MCGCIISPSIRSIKNEPQYLYSININYVTSEEIYDYDVSGWESLIMPSGITDFVTVQIPKSVTFKWKTALPGGKEYYDNLNSNPFMPSRNEDGTIPEINLYPSNLFQDHTATLVLKDKIPQPFQGEIYFTIKDSGDVVFRYIEKKRLEDDIENYKQMDEYYIFVVNRQKLGKVLYDFKGSGWPLYTFNSFPIEEGHIEKLWPNTIPPSKTTLTWKTALEGGKDYYNNFDEIIRLPSDTPRLEKYPNDKFKTHQVEVQIDSGKIVEYGKGAQLIFYIYDNDRVEIEYRSKGQ